MLVQCRNIAKDTGLTEENKCLYDRENTWAHTIDIDIKAEIEKATDEECGRFRMFLKKKQIHDAGNCRPCCFSHKSKGCSNGCIKCCHFCSKDIVNLKRNKRRTHNRRAKRTTPFRTVHDYNSTWNSKLYSDSYECPKIIHSQNSFEGMNNGQQSKETQDLYVDPDSNLMEDL